MNHPFARLDRRREESNDGTLCTHIRSWQVPKQVHIIIALYSENTGNTKTRKRRTPNTHSYTSFDADDFTSFDPYC